MTIILAVMAIGAVLEILVPLFADKPWRRGRRSASLGLTAVSFLSNWLLARGVRPLFDTFTPSDRAAAVRYGLDDAEELGRASFTGLVAMPFRSSSSEPADASVAAEVTV